MNTKLLLACAAVAAAASASADLTVQLGTTRVDSTYTNTIVAVPYTDFGGGNITVSNIVKTANLTKGDMCYVLKSGKSEYEGWELLQNADTGVLYWAPTKLVTISGGKVTETESSNPSITTLAPGKALWIVRKGDVSQPFYLWGSYDANNVPSSTVSQGSAKSPAYNLIANAGASSKKVSELITDGAVDGDEIWIPCNGIKRCVRKNGAWTGKKEEVVLPGMGVWYISKGGSGTVSW